MYATGYNEPAGVWRSEDGGESWNHSSDGIDTGERMVQKMKHKRDWVMRIVRSQSNPDVFFITTTTAIYLSKDGAKTWGKLPYDKQVAAVAIAPHNEDHLLIGLKDGFVRQSVDGGTVWSDFSEGLPSGPVPGARIIKFRFMGDDGKMIDMESTSRRESNIIASFAFDTTDPSVLYVSAASGPYRVEPFD